jgi:molybdenum cofactor cytidylyltransferase
MMASDPSKLRYGVLVLAAGASRRMGQPKQVLKLNGQPLIQRAVESALASPGWPIAVVLGAHAETIRPLLAKYPVLIAENPAWAEGMASSIRAGLGLLQQFSRSLEGAVVALCDQPAFSATTIQTLVDAHLRTGCSIVAARYKERNGAPAFFHRRHFAELMALTGESGARELLNLAGPHVTEVDMPDLAIDLDTPADFAAQSGSADRA